MPSLRSTAVIAAFLLTPAPSVATDSEDGWTSLQPGLDLGIFTLAQPSELGDSKVRIVRADPARFEAVVLAATAHGGNPRTTKEWSTEFGLAAAINSSMFDPDWSTSVSYLREGDHINSAAVTADNSVLAARPKAEAANTPGFKLIDRECDDLQAEMERYKDAVQSIRMLSCKGRNVWTQQPKQWSHAVTGVDDRGRLLLIHARSPYSTHDFIQHLVALRIGLDRLMYGDGGPPAQLYVRAGGSEHLFVGSYETGIKENDKNDYAWQIPNVIGVRAKPSRPGASP